MLMNLTQARGLRDLGQPEVDQRAAAKASQMEFWGGLAQGRLPALTFRAEADPLTVAPAIIISGAIAIWILSKVVKGMRS